jgi:GPH family glycoside/pentoside/hexuronide:cation symporter
MVKDYSSIRAKLTTGRMMLFSSASISTNIMAITVSTWLMYTYAPPPDSGRPALVPIALIGILMAVGSLVNALIDPLLGHWSDSRRGRLGRRRPFILVFLPLSVLLMILIWTPPHRSLSTTNVIYFLLVTTLYYTAHSAWQIPYDGALPEMAEEPKDRVTLAAWKNVFALVGVLIGALASGVLYNSAMGPLGMGIAVGVAALIGGGMTLLGLREKKVEELGQALPVAKGILATFKNRQFIGLFLATLFVQAAYGMLIVNLPYFVTLVLGMPEGNVAIVQGVVIIVMAFAAIFWNRIGRRRLNRGLWRTATLILGCLYAAGFLIGMIPGTVSVAMTFVLFPLIGFMLAGSSMLPYAMMGSVADYDEIKTSTRREAIYYGSFSLAVEGGPTISTLLLPVLYQNFGYTVDNPLGVRLAYLVIGALVIIGLLFFRTYKLGDTPEDVRRFVEENEGGV